MIGGSIVNHCIIGDCRDGMRKMIADGVKAQMCVTSPPYWGLRNYGVPGQLGLEKMPDCARRGYLKLRSDLTDDQRAFVIQRLLAEGYHDV